MTSRKKKKIKRNENMLNNFDDYLKKELVNFKEWAKKADKKRGFFEKLIGEKFYYPDKTPAYFIEDIVRKAIIRAINDLLEEERKK